MKKIVMLVITGCISCSCYSNIQDSIAKKKGKNFIGHGFGIDYYGQPYMSLNYERVFVEKRRFVFNVNAEYVNVLGFPGDLHFASGEEVFLRHYIQVGIGVKYKICQIKKLGCFIGNSFAGEFIFLFPGKSPTRYEQFRTSNKMYLSLKISKRFMLSIGWFKYFTESYSFNIFADYPRYPLKPMLHTSFSYCL